jgi:hypothetical protein
MYKDCSIILYKLEARGRAEKNGSFSASSINALGLVDEGERKDFLMKLQIQALHDPGVCPSQMSPSEDSKIR